MSNLIPTAAERQRQRRAYIKKTGGKRVDLYIEARLFKKLIPYLLPYGGADYAGSAILALLRDCVREWDKFEPDKTIDK